MFEIGFLTIRFIDILDILIVGYLIYLIYKLLKGSIAFNIFIGVTLLYVVWRLVELLQMDLLSLFLGQFVSVGVILLIIIFQPEVRRFLLLLGNTTLRQRLNFLERIFDRKSEQKRMYVAEIQAVKKAIVRMARNKTGALIVITKDLNLELFAGSGTQLDAKISQPLIESIFQKESPLHDGAVVIAHNRIRAASVILPVSANPDLPKSVGLRHRSAVGVTENTNVVSFVVSEENGKISFAHEGKLERGITQIELTNLLQQYF
jgi:uncharacterized protein (TIGR00159 family)